MKACGDAALERRQEKLAGLKSGRTRIMRQNSGRRRNKRQRGNTMVETALVFIPMCALFFGIIDVSFAIFIQSTFEHATREGARFAITFQSSYGALDCTTSQTTCITQVVQDNASGFLAGSKSDYLFINYYTPDDLTTPIITCNKGTCTAANDLPETMADGTIVRYPNQTGNIVEVTIKNYPWLWMVPIWSTAPTADMPNMTPGTGLGLGAASSDVLGGLAVGSTQPPPP
jgi:Flp pilus assembly protein TadG